MKTLILLLFAYPLYSQDVIKVFLLNDYKPEIYEEYKYGRASGYTQTCDKNYLYVIGVENDSSKYSQPVYRVTTGLVSGYIDSENILAHLGEDYLNYNKEDWDVIFEKTLKVLKIKSEAAQIEENKIIDRIASKTVNNGIAFIADKVFDVSDFIDGTGYNVQFFNPTKKTIKYVYISLIGINPVGDKVVANYDGTYTIKVTCVGPVKAKDFAEFSFDHVWKTDLVETFRVTKVKTVYMDGTSIVHPNLKKLYISDL